MEYFERVHIRPTSSSNSERRNISYRLWVDPGNSNIQLQAQVSSRDLRSLASSITVSDMAVRLFLTAFLVPMLGFVVPNEIFGWLEIDPDTYAKILLAILLIPQVVLLAPFAFLRALITLGVLPTSKQAGEWITIARAPELGNPGYPNLVVRGVFGDPNALGALRRGVKMSSPALKVDSQALSIGPTPIKTQEALEELLEYLADTTIAGGKWDYMAAERKVRKINLANPPEKRVKWDDYTLVFWWMLPLTLVITVSVIAVKIYLPDSRWNPAIVLFPLPTGLVALMAAPWVILGKLGEKRELKQFGEPTRRTSV